MGFIIAALLLVLIISCLRVVPQATEFVIERLGKFQSTWSAGLRFLVPSIDRVA